MRAVRGGLCILHRWTGTIRLPPILAMPIGSPTCIAAGHVHLSYRPRSLLLVAGKPNRNREVGGSITRPRVHCRYRSAGDPRLGSMHARRWSAWRRIVMTARGTDCPSTVELADDRHVPRARQAGAGRAEAAHLGGHSVRAYRCRSSCTAPPALLHRIGGPDTYVPFLGVLVCLLFLLASLLVFLALIQNVVGLGGNCQGLALDEHPQVSRSRPVVAARCTRFGLRTP